MLFTEIVFWIFLPLFYLGYFLTRGGARLWVCLVGSNVFYGWWDVRFLALIGFLTLSGYLCGRGIARSQNPKQRKRFVALSVVSSLVVLGFFKYFNFFLDSLGTVVGQNLGGLEIILPVGISFYTFQTLSYTIDLYRGHLACEKSLLRFAVFVAFFPQLVAGPIVRAAEFLPQLRQDQKPAADEVLKGLCWIAWGFVLKSVLADSLAGIVDPRFAKPEFHNAASLILGVVCYSFQIYGDFAGYSLIAIGVAKTMGFDFNANFNRPYFAASFSEFWQRWHISLSSWLRDYLYIPLGGNRKGPRRTYINLMLTMLLGGLWHGAAWTFVVWGALHGIYLCAQRLLGLDKRPAPSKGRPLRNLARNAALTSAVFLLVSLTWIFFRSQSFADAAVLLQGIAQPGEWLDFQQIPQKFEVVKAVALIAFVFLVEFMSFRICFEQLGDRLPVLRFLFIVGCVWLIALAGTFEGAAFLYFQF